MLESVETLKLGEKISTLNPQASLKISHFYQGLKANTCKTLASLQVFPLNLPTVDYCSILQEIADEQKFETTFVDLPNLTGTGMSFGQFLELDHNKGRALEKSPEVGLLTI